MTNTRLSPVTARMQELLNFLNSIEGAGYGGMASFEIARMNVRDILMHGVAQTPTQEAREKEITRLATIEECAKIAENFYNITSTDNHALEVGKLAASQIAGGIRALSLDPLHQHSRGKNERA
jgi:hypothetical protein